MAELKCKECKAPVRHPGCHDSCKEYQDWKKQQDELKAKARKNALLVNWAIEDSKSHKRRR